MFCTCCPTTGISTLQTAAWPFYAAAGSAVAPLFDIMCTSASASASAAQSVSRMQQEEALVAQRAQDRKARSKGRKSLKRVEMVLAEEAVNFSSEFDELVDDIQVQTPRGVHSGAFSRFRRRRML